jgi:hypothetical protein
MADAVAGQSKEILGTTALPVQKYQLKLENIMNEIIPLHQWHFRTADTHLTPILDDILSHQHQMLHDNMTANRDQWNDTQRWVTTATAFASKIHPPQDKSFWAAARRALIIFDWLGHGRNRSKQCKLHPAQADQIQKCPHCNQLDDQQHCMLQCSFAPLTLIRSTARKQQAAVANDLLKTYRHSADLIHFIHQMCHASWIQSPNLHRIWLGTWSSHTLQQRLGRSLDAPMTMKQRHNYIDIAKDLIAPLIHAYHQMLHLNITHKCTHPSPFHDPLPFNDHFPIDTHTDVPI